MEQPELIFRLSDADEYVIRNYECTKFSRWFSKPTIGYLTITNKRIVFHSSGQSLLGKSILIDEMPIEDAAGFSVYQGLSINWIQFLIFAAIAYVVTQVVFSIFPPFFTSYEFALLLLLPFGIIWLLSSNILNEQAKEKVFQSVETRSGGQIKVDRDTKSYLPIAQMLFYLGLAIVAWRVAFLRTNFVQQTPVGWLLLLAIYGFIYIRLSGRSRSFSLMIGSRTMKGSGIFIPGDSLRLLVSRNTAAIQALEAGPAADSDSVIRELGALLLDIQQLGDFGLEKWKR